MSLRINFALPLPVSAVSRWRKPSLFISTAILPAIFFNPFASAQINTASIAPHRYLIVYRNATIPGDAEIGRAHV